MAAFCYVAAGRRKQPGARRHGPEGRRIRTDTSAALAGGAAARRAPGRSRAAGNAGDRRARSRPRPPRQRRAPALTPRSQPTPVWESAAPGLFAGDSGARSLSPETLRGGGEGRAARPGGAAAGGPGCPSPSPRGRTHHLPRPAGEVAFRAGGAPLEQLVPGAVPRRRHPQRLVASLHGLHAGLEKQGDVHRHGGRRCRRAPFPAQRGPARRVPGARRGGRGGEAAG